MNGLRSRGQVSPSNEGTIYIIDDCRSMRLMLTAIVNNAGYQAHAFESGEEFLTACSNAITEPACLLLDVEMPGMNGTSVQQQLIANALQIPIIVISGSVDVPTAVKMMRAGAADLLEKPFTANAVLSAIGRVLVQERCRLGEARKHRLLEKRMECLSQREHEVLEEVLHGHTTKQIAAKFDIGVKTIAKHKARVLHKMGVKNDLELLLALTQPADLPVEDHSHMPS